jgi:hypothetical protein
MAKILPQGRVGTPHEAALAATRQKYFVRVLDDGLHLGEHRLRGVMVVFRFSQGFLRAL